MWCEINCRKWNHQMFVLILDEDSLQKAGTHSSVLRGVSQIFTEESQEWCLQVSRYAAHSSEFRDWNLSRFSKLCYVYLLCSWLWNTINSWLCHKEDVLYYELYNHQISQNKIALNKGIIKINQTNLGTSNCIISMFINTTFTNSHIMSRNAGCWEQFL